MKIGVNICYIELIFILMSVFKQQKLMKKNIVRDIIFVEKKTRSIRSINCKFIRIKTSNAKNGYGLDYEVSNVQAFIDEFKNKKKNKKNKKKN